MTLRPGDAFGPYTVAREVGRGGMAVVFEATHTGLKKRVALKVLHALSDDLQRRFLQEGAAASRTRHEHVVEVFDTGVIDGTPFVVMELLEGEALSARVSREGPLDAAALADVMLPVASALAAAHDAGVVHRDVKPDNIFLSRDRRGSLHPVVVDFGVARLNALDEDAQRLTGSAALIGSVAYVSPEQVLDHADISPRSDQYSLGVAMYECVTGRLPFSRPSVFGTLNAILKGEPARPSAVNPSLDPRLEAVVLRAMAREPERRFADLRALGAALMPLASPAARDRWRAEFGDAPPDVEPLPVPARRRPVRVVAAIALSVAAVTVGAVALRPSRRGAPAAPPVLTPIARPAPVVASKAPGTATAEPAARAPASIAATGAPPEPRAHRVATLSPRRARALTLPARVDAAAARATTATPQTQPAATPWMLRTEY